MFVKETLLHCFICSICVKCWAKFIAFCELVSVLEYLSFNTKMQNCLRKERRPASWFHKIC